MLSINNYIPPIHVRVVFAMIAIVFLGIRISFAKDINYTKFEVIRNGDFEQDRDAWYVNRSNISSLAGKDGSYGLDLGHGSKVDPYNCYAFQKLMIPSELNSATIRFDYGIDDKDYYDPSPVNFEVSIVASKGFDSEKLGENPPVEVIDVIHTETIATAFNWQGFRAELTPDLLGAMQAAHEAGEFVFLLFSQNNGNGGGDPRFDIYIDNVFFTINGVQHVPELGGKIAYLEDNVENEPYALDILDPNTLEAKTIWSRPEDDTIVYGVHEMAWRPDGSEIAFVSDKDFLNSSLYSDIYAIKPDGTDLRKVTELLEFNRSGINPRSLLPCDLTWKHDGSEIGFRMLGFYKIPADPKEPYVWTEVKPSGGFLSNSITWSPVDDRYLYCDYRNITINQLFVAEEGGEPRLLLENNNDFTQPAWLPDGSGFVYIGQPEDNGNIDDNIFYYDFRTEQKLRLTYFRYEDIENLSISPNGQYVVFEMRKEAASIYHHSDLWVMDRLNPTNIWPITVSGNCTKPVWSPTGGPDNNNGNNDDRNNAGGGGGGGGGCFVSNCFQ